MKLHTVKKLENPYPNTVWIRHKPSYFSKGCESTYDTDKETFDFETADNSVDRFSKYEHIAVCNGGQSINGVPTAKLEVVYKINGYFKKYGKWIEGGENNAKKRFPSNTHNFEKCENLLDLELIYKPDDEILLEWKSPRNWFTNKTPKVVNENNKKKTRSFTNISDVTLIPSNEIFELLNDDKWKTGLSQFYAVYQFRNRNTNECYVGSAYGTDGIYARLIEYRNTGHGNNKLLVEIYNSNPNFLSEYDFTILQYFTDKTPKNVVINQEQKWKKIQGVTLNLN
jgi:hypothetical protein